MDRKKILNDEIIWKDRLNRWWTNKQPICEICKRKTDFIMSLKSYNNENEIRFCMDKNNDCFEKAIELLTDKNNERHHLYAKTINYKK